MAFNRVVVSALCFLAISCSKKNNSLDGTSNQQSVTPVPRPNPSPAPGPAPSPTPTPTPITICSTLDLNGITWSSSLPTDEVTPLALALNITGSYEGTDGWSTIANDGDGQGISLGLLQQCLGQGTLQTLLVQMRDNDLDDMKAEFSTTNLNSLLKMLTQWQAAKLMSEPVEELRARGLSLLDDPDAVRAIVGEGFSDDLQLAIIDRNKTSVVWAIHTLYNGSKFKSDWLQQLTGLAVTAPYRSLQANAAQQMHQSAMSLFQTFGMKELRSYLFFFDLVVQDGGIPTTMITQLLDEIKRNPTWDETQKLNTILTVRLTIVNKKSQADVKSRKQAIINSQGVVHGVKRNFPKEYCVDLDDQMP